MKKSDPAMAAIEALVEHGPGAWRGSMRIPDRERRFRRACSMTVLTPMLSFVEKPLGWCAVLRHNLHTAAILTSLREAQP